MCNLLFGRRIRAKDFIFFFITSLYLMFLYMPTVDHIVLQMLTEKIRLVFKLLQLGSLLDSLYWSYNLY